MGSPRDKRHRQTKRVLLNIYNQKRQEWMSRRLEVVTSTEVMNFAQSLDLSQFSSPDSVGYRGGWVPKRKYTATPWQVYTNDSLNISLKIPTTIYSDDWGKRNTHTFWGLLDRAWDDINVWRPEMSQWPPVWGIWQQVNILSFGQRPTYSGSRGSMDYPSSVDCSGLQIYNWDWYTQLLNSYMRSLVYHNGKPE